MSATVKPPSQQTPEAGVIEEARARQRRHWIIAGAGASAAGVTLGLLLAFSGGGGSHAVGSTRGRRTPSKTAQVSAASCGSATHRALQGAPSKSLLSILAVLRRPATPADAIPPALAAQGAGSNAFVHYVRRTRVLGKSAYYIYPAILEGCGSTARQGIAHLDAGIDLGGGAIGATGGGGASAHRIAQGLAIGAGPPGSSTSATVTIVVPDGVATVTLRFPAGRASGYSPRIYPPFTVMTTPVNNEVVITVPRSAGGSAIHHGEMTWRGADGHVIKTIHDV